MKRRTAVAAPSHPDRTPDLRAALEALRAVPVEYAGTLRDSRGRVVSAVLTAATVDALVAAVDRVLDVVATVSACRADRGQPACVPCSRLSQAWLRWRIATALDDDPGLQREALDALTSARFSTAWPERYRSEWRRRLDALPR